MDELVLFLHILSGFTFFSGAVVAAIAFERARRRRLPGEVEALLGVARIGALLVVVGMVTVLALGLWLVDLRGRSFSEGWIAGSLGLLAISAALGAVGGRTPKRARLLAGKLAEESGEFTEELRRLLDDPTSRALSYAAFVAAVVILALMIWKPGAG